MLHADADNCDALSRAQGLAAVVQSKGHLSVFRDEEKRKKPRLETKQGVFNSLE